MPFTRPTLTTLIAQAKSDLASHLSGSDPLLRRCVEGVLARVVAGLTHGLHGHLVWLSKQLIPDSADIAWLIRWASIYGLTPTPAVKAQLELGITGTDNSVCKAGTRWATADGTAYTQNADGTIAASVATIVVTAVSAGVEGNQDDGVQLSLVSPVPGINSTGTVTDTNVFGFDQEAPATLLARLLLHLQTPPSGGGPGDYEGWGLEVSGVTRAWEVPNGDGAGTVSLYFVCDGLTPIIPAQDMIDIVQAYLDSKAPVTAEVTVRAPTPVPYDVTLSVVPDTVAVRAAVEAEIADLVDRTASALGCTIDISKLNEAVSIAFGETDHTITFPTGNVTYAVGELPVMGDVQCGGVPP